MKIIFTKHALERMKERDIGFKEVKSTLKNPDKIANNRYIKKIDSYVLIVVVNEESKGVIKIVTVFKSSKISKYL